MNIKFLGPENKDSFEVGDTIVIETVSETSPPFDDTMTKADMDTITVTIEDSDGNAVVSSAGMTNNATGEYYYSWDTSSESTGDYKVTINADKGGNKEEDTEYLRLN